MRIRKGPVFMKPKKLQGHNRNNHKNPNRPRFAKFIPHHGKWVYNEKNYNEKFNEKLGIIAQDAIKYCCDLLLDLEDITQELITEHVY